MRTFRKFLMMTLLCSVTVACVTYAPLKVPETRAAPIPATPGNKEPPTPPQVVYKTVEKIECPLAIPTAIPKDAYLRLENGKMIDGNVSGIQLLKSYSTIRQQLKYLKDQGYLSDQK